MASLNQEKMVEELSSWTVIEVAGLIKALEEKWGVKAAPAAVAVAAGPAAPAAEAKVEQTEFLVELTNAGDKKINVITSSVSSRASVSPTRRTSSRRRRRPSRKASPRLRPRT